MDISHYRHDKSGKQCYLHCTTLVFPAYGLWLWNSEFVYLTRLIARREMIYQLNNFQTYQI